MGEVVQTLTWLVTADNREVNTDTKDKSNIQTTSCKKNDKTTVHWDKYDSNLILIIILTGTNDTQNSVNTLQKIRKVISFIKEYDTDDNIKVGLSNVIYRSDHDFQDEINETNRKLENLSKDKGMIFINWQRLPDQKQSGTPLLIKYFSKTVNSVWLINENENGEVLNLANSSIVSFSRCLTYII